MCQVLKISRGGYYSWLKRPLSSRAKENIKLLNKIEEIYENSKKRYGSPRITDQLKDEGYAVSRPRVARLMRKKVFMREERKNSKGLLTVIIIIRLHRIC